MEMLGSLVTFSSLFSSSLSAQTSRVDLMSLLRFNTSDRHEVLSALPGFLVFFLFVYFFCQLTDRRPSAAVQLRVFALG
jgi:hypothetical protein